MYNLTLVLVINVVIVGVTAFLVARGSLAILPWVPLISIAILALDAITLRRKVGSEDARTRLFRGQSTLLSQGGKIVLVLLALACFWTILSSGWRMLSGRVELANIIQIFGALLVLWITVSALGAIYRRESKVSH